MEEPGGAGGAACTLLICHCVTSCWRRQKVNRGSDDDIRVHPCLRCGRIITEERHPVAGGPDPPADPCQGSLEVEQTQSARDDVEVEGKSFGGGASGISVTAFCRSSGCFTGTTFTLARPGTLRRASVNGPHEASSGSELDGSKVSFCCHGISLSLAHTGGKRPLELKNLSDGRWNMTRPRPLKRTWMTENLHRNLSSLPSCPL